MSVLQHLVKNELTSWYSPPHLGEDIFDVPGHLSFNQLTPNILSNTSPRKLVGTYMYSSFCLTTSHTAANIPKLSFIALVIIPNIRACIPAGEVSIKYLRWRGEQMSLMLSWTLKSSNRAPSLQHCRGKESIGPTSSLFRTFLVCSRESLLNERCQVSIGIFSKCSKFVICDAIPIETPS